MMTARFAVGSVSTLAMTALLLGSASLLLNRSGSAAHGTPWGDITSLSPASGADAATSDKAQLLKMAALKTNTDAPAATPPAPAISPAPAAPVTAPAPAPAAMEAVAAPPSAPPSPAPVADADPAQAAPAQAVPVEAPVQMASAAQPEIADAAPKAADDEPPAHSSLINLNKASTDTLDHIPGLGRVGRSIVAHRPYRSVKDLVNKRVLRTSDFQKIESHVRVD